MPEEFQSCGALIDALSDPAMLVAADRRILLANLAARELFGALEGALVTASLRQPDAASAVDRGLAELARGGRQAQEGRMLLATATGESVLRLTVSPLDVRIGLPAVLVVLRDVSHLEQAEQQRRDFVANVSHEMRSPLTVLSGFIETLKGPARGDPAATAQFLDIMEREAQRMAGLVADLLSLSRVEAEEKVRPRAPVSISEVVRATLAALRPQIEEAGLEISLADLPEAPPVPGDRDQLVQVLHNLLENAIRYGAAGGRIDIAIERIERSPALGVPALRVSVRDHGEGIDPIHLPRLTERFYRVDGHRSRAMGGTGLGLAIVKHIVNRHRGKLTIHSVRGEGSTFAITLPVV